MPRRRNPIRRKNRRRFRRYFRRKGARSQAGQLVRLDKRLTKLSKVVSLNRSWFQYWQENTAPCPQHTQLPFGGYGYTVFPMLDTTRMLPVFDQPTQADLDADKWVYHGSKMHLQINIDSENSSPCRVTTYLVSLRKETRATSIYNWGNNLSNFFDPQIAGTQEPDDARPNPIMCFSTGQTFINTKAFKIHRVHHKEIGEVGYGSNAPPVRNIGDTVVNYYFNVRKRIVCARSQFSIEEALDDAISIIPRNAQTFVIIVTNNSNQDSGNLNAKTTVIHKFSAQS